MVELFELLPHRPGLQKGDLVKIISSEVSFFPTKGVFGSENYFMYYHDITPLTDKIAIFLDVHRSELSFDNGCDEIFCEFLVGNRFYVSEYFSLLSFERYFLEIKNI